MSTNHIKLFGMSHQMVERDLDMVEAQLETDLGRAANEQIDRDQDYYPQFSEAIRQEAAAMGNHYELFYCLEKSIRALVQEKLRFEHGANWWTACVPESVRSNAEKNVQKELDTGVTPRSTYDIDYTTFGELGEIVRANWNSFSDTFSSLKGFDAIMTRLNVLRGPIAHCCPLAPDEVLRLRLTVKDWFRLME